jgi:ABC-type multidrug transport system fused ATPase/permease subunit
MNNVSSFTSLSLKLVGIILFLSSFLDYAILAFPFQPLEARWQIGYISTVVDRGIIPMIGIAFVLAAYWIDNAGGKPKASIFDVRLPMFVCASLLGVVFLLFVPLYLNNLRTISTDAQEQISQRATEVEQRLQTEFDQLNALLTNQDRIKELDQNIQQINQALSSGQIQGQQLNPQQKQQLEQQKQRLEGLRSLRGKPEEMEKRLNEVQTRLRSQKLETEKQAKTETLKRGLRIGLSSLMLAAGYSTIGWLGLKDSMGSKPPSSRKPKR